MIAPSLEDTIAAISTPFGEGAIALLRLSGPQAVAIAEEVFRGSCPVAGMETRRQHFGKIEDAGQVIDEVMLTVFRAPKSYTGEDVVEISGHGGILVTRRLLDLLLAHGARPAEPGEFTQRAFLNSRMDLTQAEAVMDLISAQTSLALRAATEQLEGRLGRTIREMRETVLDVVAQVEAYIDFPEEDIDPQTSEILGARLGAVATTLEQLLRTADQGRILREGVRTVIYGAPNVGKSSLLNLLLGYDRAIVSPTPGTTRDTIEEVINLRGIPLRLIDTAGLRESADALEQAGMERTRRQRDDADLVLHVVDASAPRERYDAKEMLVLNKCDLPEHADWASETAVRISCQTGAGVEALGDAIFERVMGGGVAFEDSAIAINARHQQCLRRAAEHGAASLEGLRAGLAPELLAVDLRALLDAIGEVVGHADIEEVLGRIFSTFCIGK